MPRKIIMFAVSFYVYALISVLYTTTIVTAASFEGERIPESFNSTTSSRRNLRSKKKVDANTKMKPPDIPRKGWKTCDSTCVSVDNEENNYLWAMETVERIYFFISGK